MVSTQAPVGRMLVAHACKMAANRYNALMATFLALKRVGEPLLAEQRDIPVPAAGQVRSFLGGAE